MAFARLAAAVARFPTLVIHLTSWGLVLDGDKFRGRVWEIWLKAELPMTQP